MASVISELQVGDTLYQFSASGVIITEATPTSLAGVLVGDGTSIYGTPIDEQPTEGSTNFVNSGAIAAAIGAAASNVVTGTIETTQTSVTVNYSGTLKGVFAMYGGSIVLCDTEITMNTVTFSVAEAPPAAISCYVIYGA